MNHARCGFSPVDDRVGIAVALELVLAAATLHAIASSGIAPDVGYLTSVRIVVSTFVALFVPGYLLFVIGGFAVSHVSRALLYVVGLSVAFLLVVLLVTTLVLGYFGPDPGLEKYRWALFGSIVALAVPASWRSRSRSSSGPVGLSGWEFLTGLFLVLLPVAAARGTTYLNDYGENGLNLLVLVVLALTILLVGTGVVPRRLTPLAVWSVALSIVLQMTLVSSHIWGWDVHFQYHVARDVLRLGWWNPSAVQTSNSLLTVTVLPAGLVAVTSLDLVWVYKLVYAFLVSLLPLTVYHVAMTQFEDRRFAALGALTLVIYYGFFKFFPDKQLVSLLFFGLTALVLFDDEMSGPAGRALSLTFAALLILSHYGVSLLLLAFLGSVAVAATALRYVDPVERPDPAVVRTSFLAFLAVGWVTWYMYSADGSNLERVVAASYETVAAIGQDTSSRSGVGYSTQLLETPLWFAYTLLNVALVGLVSLGVTRALVGYVRGEAETDPAYTIVAGATLAFLVSSVVLTYGMGFDRTLLIALVVLAPFAIVGLQTALEVQVRALVGEWVPAPPELTAAFFAVFIAVFFLFSSGATFALAGEQIPPYSINLQEETSWHVYGDDEVRATRWIERHGSDTARVAVFNDGRQLKSRDAMLLVEVVPPDRVVPVWASRTDLEGGTYVYVSDWPMATETSGPERTYLDPRTTQFYDRNLADANVVLDTEHARIYRLPEDGNETGAETPVRESRSGGR